MAAAAAAVAYQRQSAQLPATPLYPIRHFDMNETPILVSSCPPSLPQLSHHTQHVTLTWSPNPGAGRLFVFICCCFFPSPRVFGQKSQTKMSKSLRAHLEISLLSMCKAWWGRGCAVCLCVALLDMMRDDIMVDATAASEMRKVPICLPLAESNVSICHPPQDRTMVFIKINILCTQQYHLFIFI